MMRTKKIALFFFALILIPAFLCFAGGQQESGRGVKEKPDTTSEVVDPSAPVDWDALGIPPVDTSRDMVFEVSSPAPDGGAFTPQKGVFDLFTSGDIKKIQEGNYTAAICMHYMGAIWPQMQVAGIKKACEALNIEILTITDPKFKAEQQVADIESAIGLNPDILLIKSVADTAIIEVEKKAAAQGIKVVAIDTVANELIESGDVLGLCQADNYTFSQLAAEKICEAINYDGEVVMLNFKYPIFHTNLRSEAARDTFAKYPDVEVVAEQGMGSEEEAATVMESLVVAHPNLDGVWAAWDSPAYAALAVAKNLGKTNIVGSGPAVATDSAYSMVTDGMYIGGSCDLPYDMGITEVLMGAAALLGKDVPEYVAVPVVKLEKENLKEVWEFAYHEPLPKQIAKEMEN
jgi:ribose transport system substrate-binding protein